MPKRIDEQLAIVTMRQVDAGASDRLARGVTTAWCHTCEADVWLSPSSIRYAKRYRTHRIVCVPCLLKEPRESLTFLPMAVDARLEIAAATGRYGDQIDALLKEAASHYFGMGRVTFEKPKRRRKS